MHRIEKKRLRSCDLKLAEVDRSGYVCLLVSQHETAALLSPPAPPFGTPTVPICFFLQCKAVNSLSRVLLFHPWRLVSPCMLYLPLFSTVFFIIVCLLCLSVSLYFLLYLSFWLSQPPQRVNENWLYVLQSIIINLVCKSIFEGRQGKKAQQEVSEVWIHHATYWALVFHTCCTVCKALLVKCT